MTKAKKIWRTGIALALATTYGYERSAPPIPKRVVSSAEVKESPASTKRFRGNLLPGTGPDLLMLREVEISADERVGEAYEEFKQVQFPDDDGQYHEGELPTGPDGIVQGIEGAEPDA